MQPDTASSERSKANRSDRKGMLFFALGLAVLAALTWTARLSYNMGATRSGDSYEIAIRARQQARVLSDMLDQAVDSLAACTVARNER